ncbi:hypothetical protein EVG20_g8370 [Dentipellis fragilis]|uniref:MARVEL domain-containing protein n=1 Tax=Dentipellis fragilis TaxID=205917 RepID=A0A4Y9Y730_9AGAM|nr:hypothetical protein EVG20_g8370 [Dentipellis fragilis]
MLSVFVLGDASHLQAGGDPDLEVGTYADGGEIHLDLSLCSRCRLTRSLSASSTLLIPPSQSASALSSLLKHHLPVVPPLSLPPTTPRHEVLGPPPVLPLFPLWIGQDKADWAIGLLVVCNAIICSAGVWNLSLAQSVGSSPPVDAYMVFLGAFSLVLILPVTFFDVFAKHAWTGWVGTECVWVTLLWIFHLAGAAAVTALLPTLMCNVQMERTISDSCTSTRLLQVPAWICAIALTIYVVLFATAVSIHRRRNPTIWYASVRTYPWFDHLRSQSQQIKSAPASPIAVLAPRPTRPVDLPSPSPNTLLKARRFPPPDLLQSQGHPISCTCPACTVARYSADPVPPPSQQRPAEKKGWRRRLSMPVIAFAGGGGGDGKREKAGPGMYGAGMGIAGGKGAGLERLGEANHSVANLGFARR